MNEPKPEKQKKTSFTPEQIKIKDAVHDTYVLFFKWVSNNPNAVPVFNAIDWKFIKELTLMLDKLSNGDVEVATETFKAILRNWKSYDKFYQSNISIRFIYSNFNNYIYQYGQSKNANNQFGKSKQQTNDTFGESFGSGESISEWVH
jgi:hypothetical protein